MDEINEYEKLNNLVVQSDRTQKTVLRYAATGQFLLINADHHRAGDMCDAAGAFLDVFGKVATRFRKANGREVTIKGDNWRDYYAGRRPEEDEYDSFFIDLLSDGDIPPVRFDLFAPYSIEGHRKRAPYGRCQFHFPLPWLKQNSDAFVEHLKGWCSLLKPEQGTFGIGFVSKPGMERKRIADAWPYLARFSGLDCVTLMDWSAPDYHVGLRAVNWLTVLDDTWVERLGGQDEIARHLHPEGQLHPYEGGLIVQACTHPQLGDINMHGVPEAYAAVDALIAPHRYVDYPDNPMHLLKVPPPLDAHVTTLGWLRRFEPKDA
ncbi:MAG: type VI immunity family protein [Pseudomonadota bacterium]